ncbi:hypothetical protein VNI00_006885 [Paramarasmius palmivorus]|uniref:Uncharacterized protein n=1 Tax=Paramarasmius palmivorus TaxID=297713 RepID=A0AAW0D972_9AGAR
MGWFSEESEQAVAYDQVVNAPHKAELSHELIAAAASYEAAKAYEDHCARNGQPPSHAKAKEIVLVLVSSLRVLTEILMNSPSAGFAGAFIDRMVETKGLDYIDKERAQRHANEHVEQVEVSQWGY